MDSDIIQQQAEELQRLNKEVLGLNSLIKSQIETMEVIVHLYPGVWDRLSDHFNEKDEQGLLIR